MHFDYVEHNFDKVTLTVPTITPNIHEVADAMVYVRESMRRYAHIVGLGKIILPEGFETRKTLFEMSEQ